MKSNAWRNLAELETDDFVDGELIDARAAVIAACALIAAAGAEPVCTRCQARDEPIAAVLLLDADERAWLLCGPCRRQLPRAGVVV